MALLRITLLAPALIFSMLVPALASAAPPPELAADPAPAAEAPEPTDAAAAGGVAPADVAPEPVIVDAGYDFPEDDFEPHDPYQYDEPYEPEPERRTTLKLDSGYFSLGIAPGMTVHHKGFHPNTRFELEFGGTVEHDYRDLALSFGVVSHITPYYERKAPSFGADVTATTVLGPVYIRTGLGALGGLPRAHMLHETAAGIGGVVGAGLTFGRAPMVRVGVDYDLRVNTHLEPVHTVFLAVRLVCCRKD